MKRRTWLLGGFGLALAALTPAAAHGATGAGTTLALKLKNAPYPTKQGAYDDNTVLVFVPSFFRPREDGRLDFVVHFHGHNTTTPSAITNHKLREQLSESRQNAVLVVPQGPVRAADGDFGKLMQKNGLKRLLSEVTAQLIAHSKQLGKSSVRKKSHLGRVVASAHSGGYRAAAAVSSRGGVDLREIYLFDALYGEVDAFASFMARKKGDRKLVSYYVGGRPRELSLELANTLENKGVAVKREKPGERLSRADLVHGRAIFLAGQASHASATYEEQALRDCLFASCLEGRGSEEWHAEKSRKRSS